MNCKVISSHTLTARSALDLLLAGQAHVLIGTSESAWFEAKSKPYDLDDGAQKIELAQDVARFANSEEAGLLVVGLRTRRTWAGEIIASIVPADLESLDVRRFRSVIDARVFPPIDGLTVETVGVRPGCGLLALLIPRQADAQKPFLVHGAIVGDRVEGAFISIVRRRGEASIPTSAAAIHSMLVAGRNLLKAEGNQPAP